MSVFVIILIILLGIVLLLVEFLIIPGITIAGIGGFILMGGGTYFAYKFHGNEVGNYFLLGTIIATILAMYFAFRSKTWKKLGLKSSIDSKFESFDKSKINIGDWGVTTTRLAPIGKAMVNDIICEAKSLYEFIDEKTEIEVTKVINNQIIVKLKNKT